MTCIFIPLSSTCILVFLFTPVTCKNRKKYISAIKCYMFVLPSQKQRAAVTPKHLIVYSPTLFHKLSNAAPFTKADRGKKKMRLLAPLTCSARRCCCLCSIKNCCFCCSMSKCFCCCSLCFCWSISIWCCFITAACC